MYTRFNAKEYSIKDGKFESFIFENERGILLELSSDACYSIFEPKKISFSMDMTDILNNFIADNKNLQRNIKSTIIPFITLCIGNTPLLKVSRRNPNRGYVCIKGHHDSDNLNFDELTFRFPMKNESERPKFHSTIISSDIFIHENIVPALKIESIMLEDVSFEGVISYNLYPSMEEDTDEFFDGISKLIELVPNKIKSENIFGGIRLSFSEPLSKDDEMFDFIDDEGNFLFEKMNGMTYDMLDCTPPDDETPRNLTSPDWGVWGVDYKHVNKLYYDKEEDCFYMVDGIYQSCNKDEDENKDFHIDEIQKYYLNFPLLNELYNDEEIKFDLKRSFENFLICMKVPIELGYLEPYRTQVFDELFKELSDIEVSYGHSQVIYKSIFFVPNEIWINLSLFPTYF